MKSIFRNKIVSEEISQKGFWLGRHCDKNHLVFAERERIHKFILKPVFISESILFLFYLNELSVEDSKIETDFRKKRN